MIVIYGRIFTTKYTAVSLRNIKSIDVNNYTDETLLTNDYEKEILKYYNLNR